MTIDAEMNLSNAVASEFIDAWRHIHGIFSDEGVGNVEWVWCPNYLPTNYNDYYPGDDCVHWVGTVGFCWNDGNSASALFGNILKDFATRYPHKPAVLYTGGYRSSADERGQWIADAYGAFGNYGNLKAVIWWNEDVTENGRYYDFRVVPTESKSASVPERVTDAYKNAVSPAAYISTLPLYEDLPDGGGGGESGVRFTLNPSAVPRGGSFTLNWTLDNVTQRVDAYLGAVTPGGKLYLADVSRKWSTAIRPIASGYNPNGTAAGRLDFPVPGNIPTGVYTIEAVIVPAGEKAGNAENWLGGMYSSPLPVQ